MSISQLIDDLVDSASDLDDLMKVVEDAQKGNYGKVLRDVLDDIEGKINDAYDSHHELVTLVEDLEPEDFEE